MTQILFIGPGAIGGLLCWQVQASALPYAFRHRPDLKLPRSLVEDGRTVPLAWDFPPPGTDFGGVELVIVSCKATQVESAVTPLLPVLGHASWLICCNGLGPQQWLAEQAPGRVLWGTTTEAARRETGQRIRRTGHGRTLVGPSSGHPLTTATEATGRWLCDTPGPLEVHWDPSVESRLWLKLAINAVINPITAVQGCRNGALVEAAWRDEIEALCHEIQAVATGLGRDLPADLAEQVRQVARMTADNDSSMRQDIEYGRPTEIEFINGYLIRRAFDLELTVPRLTHWYQAVLQLT